MSDTANKQIARAAGTVMLAILFGQLAGLARGIIIANVFGASPELDSFYAANRVSETLFLLVAGGALGSAFIPAFASLLARDDNNAAWKLASSLANTVTLTLSLLAVLIALFAPQVVRFALAPGFSANPALFALTVSLLRIQLISAVLFGLGGLIVGILNAHQVFVVPALTPAVYQLGIIFGAIVLTPSMGIYGLAWGVVIGAGMYLLIQFPSLVKLLADHRPQTPDHQSSIVRGLRSFSFGWHDANVRLVLILMIPRLFGVAVVQLNFWVNTNLASKMEEGSVASLTYGFSLMIMAQAAIAQSVAIAALPTFSAQHALGKLDEMRASLAAIVRGILLLALPATAGLIILREPLIAFLYQRGEFDGRDVQLVAWALLWFAAGLVGHSIMEILTRAFYAQQDTKTPVIVGTVAMGLNVLFSILFSRYFASIGWFPLGGLALANSLATALEATALFIFMRKRLNGIEADHIARGFLQASIATLAMIVVLFFWQNFNAAMPPWILVLGGIAAGGLTYALILIALHVSEVRSLLRFVQGQIQRT